MSSQVYTCDYSHSAQALCTRQKPVPLATVTHWTISIWQTFKLNYNHK